MKPMKISKSLRSLIAAVVGCGVLTLAAGANAVAAPASLESRILASINLQKVPANLTPSLVDIHTQTPFTLSGGRYVQRICDPYDHPEQAANPQPCIYGNKTATKTVVLWGDSNAGNWMPALDGAFAALGYKLAVFTFPGCPTAFVTATKTGPFADPSNYVSCNTFHANLPAAVKKLNPYAIMGVSGAAFVTKTTAIQNQWIAGMTAAFNAMTAGQPAVRRFIIGTSPILPTDVPKCLALHSSAIQVCSSNTVASGYTQKLARDVAEAAAAKATLIPTSTWFCQNKICPPVMGSTLIYVDVDHTTIEYSKATIPTWTAFLRAKGF